MEIKKCKKCEIEKEINEFRLRKDKNGKYYRYSYCKDCEKKYASSTIAKERKKLVDKKYREKNIKKICLHTIERKKKDKMFKLKCQIRCLLWNSFNKKNKNKLIKNEKILGCNTYYFTKYLLQTFKNNYGYEWDGKEKVHIDHIIPLKTAQTEKEIIELCNYKNLQLLKEVDNLRKKDKLKWELCK